MCDIDLEPIKARMQAATEGPWESDWPTGISQHWSHPEPWTPVVNDEIACMAYCYGGSVRPIESEADAEFIAHSRTDIPALIAEVERLRALLTAEPTEAEVEAGGRALWVTFSGQGATPWRDLTDADRDEMRKEALAVLRAAREARA